MASGKQIFFKTVAARQKRMCLFSTIYYCPEECPSFIQVHICMPIWFSFVVWKCCFTFIFIFFAWVFSLHVCICSIYFLDTHWGEKKASDPLRLVLWTAVSLPDSAGHWLQVLWNSNKCSQPPSQISSPRSGIWGAEVGLLVSGSHSQFGSKALSLGRQLKGKADRVNRAP